MLPLSTSDFVDHRSQFLEEWVHGGKYFLNVIRKQSIAAKFWVWKALCWACLAARGQGAVKAREQLCFSEASGMKTSRAVGKTERNGIPSPRAVISLKS